MKRLRAALVNLCVTIVSTLVALLLAEGLVRVVAPQQTAEAIAPRILQPDSAIAAIPRAHLQERVDTGEGSVWYFTDSLGLRVSRSLPPDTASTRVLMLGDSFVQGLMVEAEQTFAGQTEALLGSTRGSVRTYNAGVSGHSPYQYYVQGERMAGSVRPSAVVVTVYVGNDLIGPADTLLRPLSATSTFGWPTDSMTLRQHVLYPLDASLRARSHAYVLARTRMRLLLARLGVVPYLMPEAFQRDVAHDPRWAFTARTLLRIQTAYAARGTPTLYMLMPAVYQVYPEDFWASIRAYDVPAESVDLDQPQRMLAAQLRSGNAVVVDLLPVLRTAAKASPPLYGSVDRHLTVAGHSIVADTLAKALVVLLNAPSLHRHP